KRRAAGGKGTCGTSDRDRSVRRRTRSGRPDAGVRGFSRCSGENGRGEQGGFLSGSCHLYPDVGGSRQTLFRRFENARDPSLSGGIGAFCGCLLYSVSAGSAATGDRFSRGG